MDMPSAKPVSEMMPFWYIWLILLEELFFNTFKCNRITNICISFYLRIASSPLTTVRLYFIAPLNCKKKMRMEYQHFSIFRKFFLVSLLFLSSVFSIPGTLWYMSHHFRVQYIVLEQFDSPYLLKWNLSSYRNCFILSRMHINLLETWVWIISWILRTDWSNARLINYSLARNIILRCGSQVSVSSHCINFSWLLKSFCHWQL